MQQIHESKGGVESWEFSLSSWVEAFVYCSVACCGETALELGSTGKHLYVRDKFSKGFMLPVLFTSQTLFGLFGQFGRTGLSVATGRDSLGGHITFQAVCA